MKILKRLLVLIALTTSVGVHAKPAPVIKVDEYRSLSQLVDHDSYSFTIRSTPAFNEVGDYTASFEFLPVSPGAGLPSLVGVVFGILKKEDHGPGWSLVDARFGAGSFSFHAKEGIYKAFVDGINFSGAAAPYHWEIGQVCPVPEPETWALMLLGLGFIVYQVRRRPSGSSAWSSLPATERS